MKKLSRILVAVDNSQFSTEILSAASARGWEPGTQVKIISVVQPASNQELREQFARQCEVILDERVKTMASVLPGCEITGECLEGDPAKLIVETAESWSADLIIMGSHGDTGPRPAHVESVAAAIVNSAPCSVAVVKLKKQLRQSGINSKQSSLAGR